MGEVKVDLAGGHAGVLEHVLNRVAHDRDGPTEDGSAIHVHIVQALFEQLRRGGQAAAARRPAQEVAAGAVGAEAVAEDTLIGPAARHEDRAGTVAEERVGFDVLGIDDARIGVAADDEGKVAQSGRDVSRSSDEGVHESGAGGL